MNNDKNQEQYTPPFKRLNQKELLTCLQHGWTGKITFIKAPTAAAESSGSGKYARMLQSIITKKDYASAIVHPSTNKTYRQVNYTVVKTLENKGLVTIVFLKKNEAEFFLKR